MCPDGYVYDLTVIDNHNYTANNVVVHNCGAFPKPSQRTQKLKKIVGDKNLILLSGTPTPESFSQIYHQFWISNHSPFKESSFYKWAHIYVSVKKKRVAYGNTVNDYSSAKKELINPVIEPYMISYTQKAAGFKTKVDEEVLTVEMKPQIYELAARLKRDKVYEGESGVILCDTPVKLQMKLAQIYSGTIKLEDGTTKILDRSKAEFIKSRFANHKIGIFYRFIAELELLKEVYGDNLTTDVPEFDATDKNIALQIVSGREGISLRNAEYLIFFNIDFSATSYWQARDRMTTKDRAFNKVYWIFSKGGIEQQIYNTVQGKKSYTTEHFKRWIK